MADTAVPGTESGQNFYEPLTPEGRESPPAATVQVHNSEKILREMPPEDAREIFGHEVTAEWSPEQAVEELRKQRSLQNSQPNRTVAFARDGRRSTQTDKEAASDLSFSRRVEHANRILEALPGIGPERAVATASEALTGGHIHEYPLGDEKAPPLSHGDDPRQAQQRLSAMREERAAALHALAEQLSTPVEQPQQPPAEVAPPIEQPPEPPAPSPDLEAQRRIEASIQSAQEYQRLSADEVHVGARLQQAAQNFYQKYGDPTPQQVAELEKTNPALVKQLAQDYQLVLSENAHLKDLRERREFKERQISETRAAELARVNTAEQEKANSAFEAHVTKVDPQWSDASYRTSLQQMAKDIIEEMRPGSSAAIARGEVHVTFNEQKNIYDAARMRLMDQRVKEARESGRQKAMDDLPKVFRPGTIMSKGEIGAADFNARLNRLGNIQSVEGQMREAARLARERRGMR